MAFILNFHTTICYDGNVKAVENAVAILARDIGKKFKVSGSGKSTIRLRTDSTLGCEAFYIEVSDEMIVRASDELGFVYGMLYISEKFLGISPFWFWMDQKIGKVSEIPVEEGRYDAVKPVVKYRGWFINDEVLIMKWKIYDDGTEPWRMVFEALLRCGGNMVIPGTDKNSKKYRQIASDMGLWITHHHAEPLGAEMFTRLYPDKEPNYTEAPELFHKLWEDGIIAQKDMKVIWCLGFRGQGDCPFWLHDSSGRFDTSAKRGKLISEVIELQRQLVMKYVDNPVLCTNLYGEIMELYEEGHISLHRDIIKIYADNGFGKMVTRRRNNHTLRLPAMPKEAAGHSGIYYHVSFYDLQAANHITMLPNSVDFVDRELTEVMRKNATDYWIINCSNVRPHTYYLDAVRKKWFGGHLSDETHSLEFVKAYYGGELSVAELYRDYHKAMAAYGVHEDEHAGEQFYTENVRLLVHEFFNEKFDGTDKLKWLVGEQPLGTQVRMYADICRRNFVNIESYYKRCLSVSDSLAGDRKKLFDATLLLQAQIHYYGICGVIAFGDGYREYQENRMQEAFMKFGDSADSFWTAERLMRGSEYGVWSGFYFNDCFADIKHTAYMVEKMMGYVRERGDNAGHDEWYRDAVYAPEDRRVLTLLVNDNHMTDRELYQALKEKEKRRSVENMLFGVDYYPEHWDRSDWKEHARLMREGNFNAVRIAEFAWGRLEPEEGRFDFSWLDEVIDTLAAEGIKVILGTPTAAPPRWLVKKYDVYMRDKYGRPRGYGSRRECCSNHPSYIERSNIIVEKLAERYGKNTNVIAWQIDNEFGCHGSTRCYCEHCKKSFSKWLKKSYGTIDELNKKYGTVFWSQEYDDFDDVILPAYTSCEGSYGDSWAHNPSLDMDFFRFSSDSWIRYERMQIDVIRRYSDYPVTHNMMGHFSDIDYYKLGEPLDVVAWDNYIDNQWNHNTYENTSMAHELMRGVKNQNFWVMEQQAGPCGWDKFGGTPRPGQLRLWTYQALAHGCEGMIYFRFKSVPFGMEQYWLGVIDHDGIPRRRYYELQQTGGELKRLSQLFVNSEAVTDVLIVKSYEHVWSHKIKSHVQGFDYRELLYAYYKANHHLGTNPACGSEAMIGEQYKVVYMPACVIVSEELKLRLEQYVRNGGVLVFTYRSGIKDLHNNMITSTIPGHLRELTGITVQEFDSSSVRVKLTDGFGESTLWRDILEIETANAVVQYDSGYYKNSAAVTVNHYGEGAVWYVGCDLEEPALERLVKMISDAAGVRYTAHPAGTEIVKRRAGDREYVMLLNYTADKKETGMTGNSLLTGGKFDGTLGGYEVEILES